jgi:hypothetical protein
LVLISLSDFAFASAPKRIAARRSARCCCGPERAASTQHGAGMSAHAARALGLTSPTISSAAAVRRRAPRSVWEQPANQWLASRARFLRHAVTAQACCCFGSTLVDRAVCHEGLAGLTLWLLFAHGHCTHQLAGCILHLQWLKCAALSTLRVGTAAVALCDSLAAAGECVEGGDASPYCMVPYGSNGWPRADFGPPRCVWMSDLTDPKLVLAA